MPHSGYTDGMEARYIIQYDPFTELHVCKWESLVEIEGERHIVHANAYIPRGENHESWLKIHNPLAIEELEKAYIDYLTRLKKSQILDSSNISNN